MPRKKDLRGDALCRRRSIVHARLSLTNVLYLLLSSKLTHFSTLRAYVLSVCLSVSLSLRLSRSPRSSTLLSIDPFTRLSTTCLSLSLSLAIFVRLSIAERAVFPSIFFFRSDFSLLYLFSVFSRENPWHRESWLSLDRVPSGRFEGLERAALIGTRLVTLPLRSFLFPPLEIEGKPARNTWITHTHTYTTILPCSSHPASLSC